MGRLNLWRRSVAVRLSLGFATLFTVGFCAIFALLYWTLERHMEERDTDALKESLQQYSATLAAGGLAALQERVSEEGQNPHVRTPFIRIIGPTGNAIWLKIPPDWIESDVRRVVIPGGWAENKINSIKIPRDEQQDLAIVAQALPGGLVLQVGRSTDSRTVLLEPLRRTFLWVGGAVLIVGIGVGFLAAWRATRPLHSVVETARKIIRTGALDARVPEPRRDDDVAELVRHFNSVLDKNAALVRGMREALDNVAHDLRTPLTSIRGTAELALGRAADPAGAQDALADCVERADEVLNLLRAIMEISEAEAGMLHLDRSPCDLGELARGPVELYTDVAESRGLRLTAELPEAIPLFADATRLRQAIANLLDNAVKYTPPGGQVSVRAEVRNGEAVLEVRDTGPGVPPDEQPRIWERLYRGDQSRSQSGLGLGLSLVRAVVEAHGGRATVANAETGGAIFQIHLPLAAAAAPQPAAAQARQGTLSA